MPTDNLAAPTETTPPTETTLRVATETTLLDAVVSVSEDHVFVLDAQNRFLYVCTGGAAALGLERSLWLNKTSAEIGLPAYFQDILAAGIGCVRAGEQPARGQMRMPAQAGGSEREFDYTVLSLPSEAVVFTARDVTDRNQFKRASEVYLTELTQMNARLATLATTDSLTSLLNYRALHERLAEEFVRANRHDQPLSVLMLDLDHFKTINDTRGHPAGDDALRALAGVMRQAARETDILGRYGGEEFVVILPQTDANSAWTVAERLRAAVEAAEGPLSTVTISIGVCSLHVGHADYAALMHDVDAALYRSKVAGRNRLAI